MFVRRKNRRSSARQGLVATLRVACSLSCSLHSLAALAHCSVRAEGLRLSGVLVRPAQAEPLLLDLGSYVPGTGVESAIVTLPDVAGGAAKLQVLGAIAFEAARRNPVFSIQQELTTNHGMVRILPGALFSEGMAVIGTLSFQRWAESPTSCACVGLQRGSFFAVSRVGIRLGRSWLVCPWKPIVSSRSGAWPKKPAG